MPQITGKVTEQIRAFFDEMREEMGAGNDAVVIAHLVKAYQAKESKQPAAAAVKSSEAVFYAKIDPRDQPLIKEMRDALYDAYNYRRDEAILRHFAKMNRSIDNQVIYLIKPPKNINELIQQKGTAADR